MPLQDFARQVGGDRVEVVGLLDAESEPHDYEPTPSDADAVAGGPAGVAHRGRPPPPPRPLLPPARAPPAGGAATPRNAPAYKARLDRMAAGIRRSFAGVPEDRRVLVTSHDAFGYFARVYDVEIVGSVLPTVSGEAEPSARQVRHLIEEVRARDVGTVFTEKGVAPRLEQRIAEEAGARVSAVLYADSLGPPGSPTSTFIGAEVAN